MHARVRLNATTRLSVFVLTLMQFSKDANVDVDLCQIQYGPCLSLVSDRRRMFVTCVGQTTYVCHLCRTDNVC